MKEKLKELHLATSFQSLLRQASQTNAGIAKSKSIPNLIRNADRLYVESQSSDDQEKDFLFLSRFLNVCDRINELHDDPIYFGSLYGGKINDAKLRIAELANVLNQRYEDKYKTVTYIKKPDEAKKTEVAGSGCVKPSELTGQSTEGSEVSGSVSRESTVSSTDTVKSSNDGIQFISSKKLVQLYERSPSNIVIFDLRPIEDFNESRIHTLSAINIPEEYIYEGLSANRLGTLLIPTSQQIWTTRNQYDLIVMMDWRSAKDAYLSPKMAQLSNIMRWDVESRACAVNLAVLKGGYLDFLDTYPMMCLNPNSGKQQSYMHLDEMLDLEAIEYPDDATTTSKRSLLAVSDLQNSLTQIGLSAMKSRLELLTDRQRIIKHKAENFVLTLARERFWHQLIDDVHPFDVDAFATQQQTEAYLHWLYGQNESIEEEDTEVLRLLADVPPSDDPEIRLREDEAQQAIDALLTECAKTHEERQRLMLRRLDRMDAHQKEPPRSEVKGRGVPAVDRSTKPHGVKRSRAPDSASEANLLRELREPHPEVAPPAEPADPIVPDVEDRGAIDVPELEAELDLLAPPQPQLEVEAHVDNDDRTGGVVGLATVAKHGLIGLINSRNMCYMNAIFQCLRHLPCIREITYNDCYKHMAKIPKPNVIIEFGDMIKALYSNRYLFFDAYAMYRKMVALVPEYGKRHHEDAMEFLMYLLKYLIIDTGTDVSVDQDPATWTDSQRAWLNHHDCIDSYFINVFYHQIRVSCKCTKCNTPETVHYETNYVIYVDAPTKYSDVGTAYAAYMKRDTIPCRKCDSRLKLKKIVTRLPTILTLQLTRYHPVPGKSLVKDKSQCTFPMDLTFGNGNYKLHAITLHGGTMMTQGHYTALCLNPETNGWYHFNDNHVGPSNMGTSVKSKVFALFYHLQREMRD